MTTAVTVLALTVLPSWWTTSTFPSEAALEELTPDASQSAVDIVGIRADVAAKRQAAENASRDVGLKIATGLGAITAALLAWGRVELSRMQHQTDRLTRAVEQLGARAKQGDPDPVDIRLGGVFALKRLAAESEADRLSVYEILAAFVRQHGAASASAPARTQDLQAAIATLRARFSLANDPHVDLSATNLLDANLSGADFAGADFSGAILRGADLSLATLYGADLSYTDLRDADLTEAKLLAADLRGADLRGADLGGASLFGADLRRADLRETRLLSADLRSANLEGANLEGVSLDGVELGEALQPPVKSGGPDRGRPR